MTRSQELSEGILSTIGQTPLVELKRLYPRTDIQVFAKLEAFNPGGSCKDRAALEMILGALERHEIGRDTVIIESSSGNMGIGLAQICKKLELRFICVVDDRTTPANLRILEAYGAEIEIVRQRDAGERSVLEARIERVKALLQALPNSYWTNQYANEDNARAHWNTMREIATALDDRVDYVFCATSTCGTLRGCAEYLRAKGLSTRLIAVDAIGSVIFGGCSGQRLLPGHGAGRRPELYQPALATRCVHVSDRDCVIGCRRLLSREAIMAGGSAGGVVMALFRVLDELPPDARCAMILADRGERYIDTIFSDDWVRSRLGEISTQWED